MKDLEALRLPTLLRAWPMVAAAFVYFVLDQGAAVLAGDAPFDITNRSLLWRSVTAAPLLWLGAAAISLGWLWRFRVVAGSTWSDFEQGRAFRTFAMVCAALVIVRFALYDYNWVAGQWHLADRLLLVACVAALWWRPIALLPLIVMAHVMSSQFAAPLLSHPAQSDFEFGLGPMLAMGACLVVSVTITKREVSAAFDMAPLLIAAVLAADFWFSGVFKILIGWWANDLSAVPVNGYLQGWRGNTDGDFARDLSGGIDALGLVVPIVVLLYELAFAVAVFRRQWFSAVLTAAPLFHLIVFFGFGFMFLDRVIVEIAFIWLVGWGLHREWVTEAWRPSRAFVAVGLVVAPSWLLFGAAHLAWFDSPAIYRYDIVAVTVDGDRLPIEPASFEPYDPQAVWVSYVLGPVNPQTGPYGATTSRTRFEALSAVESFEALEAIEAENADISLFRRDLAVAFLARFVEASHERRTVNLPNAPVFLAAAPGPLYRGEPIDHLEVTQVTYLRIGDEVLTRRQPAMTIGRDGAVVDATTRFDVDEGE